MEPVTPMTLTFLIVLTATAASMKVRAKGFTNDSSTAAKCGDQ
jgi:hypothetical protein